MRYILTPYAMLAYPWNFPLWRSDTRSLVITADIVFIPPPPIPAIALEATKAHKLVEAPHKADPIKKTTVADK